MNETEWRAQNKYSQLTIDKGAKAIQWSKDFQQIFKQMMLDSDGHIQRMDPYTELYPSQFELLLKVIQNGSQT